MEKTITIDFETFGIQSRPVYPPYPTAVVIKYMDEDAKAYVWGHSTENTCSFEDAKIALQEAYNSGYTLLFHNAKFDVDICEIWFNLPRLPFHRYHDTMLLAFLYDPNNQSLGLKQLANQLLGWPAEERDALNIWLVENQPIKAIKITQKSAGKYIAFAPGNIVASYAVGDVDRTEALYKLFYPYIIDRKMINAYNRERELMLYLIDIERQGVRIDVEKLKLDLDEYLKIQKVLDKEVIRILKAPKDLNIDSSDQLMAALEKAKMLDLSKVEYTTTGKMSASAEVLDRAITNKQLKGYLRYRAALNTCVKTFMLPWYEVAQHSNGLIFTAWHQVRNAESQRSSIIGTRTGRLSSTPNFQNIPNEFEKIFKDEGGTCRWPATWPKFKALPFMKSYIIPYNVNQVLLDRDYSQQEMRIFAHYEAGEVCGMYGKNPRVDAYDFIRKSVQERLGIVSTRDVIKGLVLGILYGMGMQTLADRLKIPVEEAKLMLKSVKAVFPGIKALTDDMKDLAKQNSPFYTWGDRQNYCEPSKLINGVVRTFEYKMINTLIQGSAADCSKEAIIRFMRKKQPSTKLLLSVHDELLVSADESIYKQEMKVLKECMESVEFDVTILSDGFVGYTWEDVTKYEDEI